MNESDIQNPGPGRFPAGGADFCLDFVANPISEILQNGRRAEKNEAAPEPLPEIADYADIKVWIGGFLDETSKMPGLGRTFSVTMTEFVRANLSGNEWRPDLLHSMKRAYERYADKVADQGFERPTKSQYVQILIRDLQLVTPRLFSKFLNLESLENDAQRLRLLANANPSDVEIRKLRNQADTLVLSRSQFMLDSSARIPGNACVRFRTAVRELCAKLDRSVEQPPETSILKTPVSQLVSRALTSVGFGKKKKS